jgi:protein-L-isoaspartate O-methyltransferase
MNTHNIDSIDWNQLWKDDIQLSRGKSGSSVNWDEHAEEFERQYSRSDYRDKLLDRVRVEQGFTVLDVGCGPGNIAVPLASRARSVTALDISNEMLRLAKKEADAQKSTNITFMQLDWNEAVIGKDIQPHDIVICSRAFASQNPQDWLLKLNRAAKCCVYLTLATAADESTAFSRDLYKTIGKEYKLTPNYIYGYNLLYRMGILAHVDFIDYTDTFRYARAEDAYKILSGHTHVETQEQKDKLMAYITHNMDRNGGFKLDRKCKWALLWWNPSTMAVQIGQ